MPIGDDPTVQDDEHAEDPHAASSDFGADASQVHDDRLLYGVPDHDRHFQHWQTRPYLCDPAVERGIYEAITGEDVPETDVAVEAAQCGFLTTAGTLPEHVGRWLEMRGIPCHSKEDGTFLDVIQELREGNKVIVGVDSNALWYSTDSLAAFHSQAADHAIWLTGVDATDPQHIKIIINDSGRPDGAGNVYDLHDLEAVMHHPGFHYVATGHGPSHLPEDPQGYDSEHGIFSGLEDFLRDHGIAVASLAADIGTMAVAIPPQGRARPATGRKPVAAPGESTTRPIAEQHALPAPPLRLEDRSGHDLAPEIPATSGRSNRPNARSLADVDRAGRDKLLRDS